MLLAIDQDTDRLERTGLLAAAVIIILAGIVYVASQLTSQSNTLPMNDFVEYWSAARVYLQGRNPYDGAELLFWQKQATGNAELGMATMMWNPPWVITLAIPFGLLPAGLAHLLFLAGQIAAVVVSATWLWRVYQGPSEHVWLAWMLALFCGPTAFLIWYGQIAGLCLLGLSGFLYFNQRNQPAVAGLFAALTAIKPHLLFGFGLVLVLNAIVTRQGRIALAAGCAAVAVAAGTVHAIHPEVYRHYAGAGWESSSTVATAPKDWHQPLFSYWLRKEIDPAQFWMQFVPTLAAATGIAWYWLRRRAAWDWPSEMPFLIFTSVLCAAYGAWIFDLVVLIVPMIALACVLIRADARLSSICLVGYLALTTAAIACQLVVWLVTGSRTTGLHTFIWYSPAVLAFYLAGIYAVRRHSLRRASEPAVHSVSLRDPKHYSTSQPRIEGRK